MSRMSWGHEPHSYPMMPGEVCRAMLCKICQANARHAYTLDDLEVYRCPQCGLLFLGNPPAGPELKESYANSDAPGYYGRIAAASLVKFETVLRDLRPHLPANGSLLDLGCGDGAFLSLARDKTPGLRAIGVELTENIANLARGRGLEIYTSELNEIGEQFDAITMLDVLEHVSNPVELLAECGRHLKSGGVLCVHTPRLCLWDRLFVILTRTPLRFLSLIWLRSRVSKFHLQVWDDRALSLAVRFSGLTIKRFHALTELSWPIEQYLAVYVWKRFRPPRVLSKILPSLVRLVLVRMGMLRNKAVLLAGN
jgi:2-polyprenyl-3-methyl-5-hydroxy-6-metoxy-1,4-benzoquinol methylase